MPPPWDAQRRRESGGSLPLDEGSAVYFAALTAAMGDPVGQGTAAIGAPVGQGEGHGEGQGEGRGAPPAEGKVADGKVTDAARTLALQTLEA